MPGPPKFTAGQWAAVRARYARDGADALARDLGLTRRQVWDMARKLRLTRRRTWAAAELAELARLYGGGLTEREIAARLGKTMGQVRGAKWWHGVSDEVSPHHARGADTRAAVMAGVGLRLRISAIAELAGVSPQRVRDHLRDLAARGVVRRTGRSTYEPTAEWTGGPAG